MPNLGTHEWAIERLYEATGCAWQWKGAEGKYRCSHLDVKLEFPKAASDLDMQELKGRHAQAKSRQELHARNEQFIREEKAEVALAQARAAGWGSPERDESEAGVE